jgi:hypothetical protein
MKKSFTGVVLVFLLIATVFAGAFLKDFRGRSEGDNIRIEWETGEETNLQHFILERKTPESIYLEIATIPPKGNNSFYSYLDESAYKSNDLIFIYRLKIVDTSGQFSYSSSITVTNNVSTVKRTWGSIKAMFR